MRKSTVEEALKKFQPVQFPDEDKYLTKEETGELLGGISNSTIDSLRRKGILKAHRFGGNVRFLKSEVLKTIKRLNS